MLRIPDVRKKVLPKPAAGKVVSGVIGVSQLAAMFEESRDWARGLLREWHEEQLNGGPVRVFKRKGRGPHAAKGSLYTTLAVVQRELPAYRDPVLFKRLAEYEKDLDNLARRVNFLTSEVAFLRKKAGQ